MIYWFGVGILDIRVTHSAMSMLLSFSTPASHGCCIKDPRSGRSVGFFLRHRSTKSLMLSEKILLGNFGGGWLTMYSNSSNMAIGFIPGDLGVRGVRG